MTGHASPIRTGHELEIDALDGLYERTPSGPHVTRYARTGRFFYVLADGNAVNFLHGASVGAFIFLVQAEILAALRELEEETGISWHGTVSPPGHDLTPVDIDVHEIPANPAKGEPTHWHADFRYAFWVQDSKVRLQYEEVIGWQWRPRADAPTLKLADL